MLWLGQLCSQFGDRLTQLVLVALSASRASGSTLSLAKVLVATSLPALLLNPFAGVYVDRWDRKRTMIVCDLIRAGILLTLPWLARAQSAAPLYAGVFVIFSVATFFIPARLAMIPNLVPANQLAQANALFTSSGMIGATGILLLGALLVEWIGAIRSCWVNAASYVASAVFVVAILRPKGKIRRSAGPVGVSQGILILHEIREGLEELWRNRQTQRAMALLALLMGGAGASVVAATVLVQQRLGTVTKDLGFLSLWIGVGTLAGTLAYGRWGTRLRRRMVLGLAFLGCGVALGAFVGAVEAVRSGVGACAAAGFLGFWIAPVGILTNTLVHEGHPQRMHGRIFSSLGVVVNLSLIGSMLTAGWLVDQGGRGMLLGTIGGLFAFSGILLLCYTRSR